MKIISIIFISLIFCSCLSSKNVPSSEVTEQKATMNFLEGIKVIKKIKTSSKNVPPKHGIFLSKPWNYHTCPECKSLDGGCYPKRSISRFTTEKGKECIHLWHLISKEDFSTLWKKSTNKRQPY